MQMNFFEKLYELRKENPEKQFYLLSEKQLCMDMKYITLEKILSVLENETNEMVVSEELRRKALAPLERMLELAK